jgi:hypothetical protein
MQAKNKKDFVLLFGSVCYALISKGGKRMPREIKILAWIIYWLVFC